MIWHKRIAFALPWILLDLILLGLTACGGGNSVTVRPPPGAKLSVSPPYSYRRRGIGHYVHWSVCADPAHRRVPDLVDYSRPLPGPFLIHGTARI